MSSSARSADVRDAADRAGTASGRPWIAARVADARRRFEGRVRGYHRRVRAGLEEGAASRLRATVVITCAEGESGLDLADQVNEAISTDPDHLVIEADAAPMLSSRGLEALHGAAQRLEAHGGQVTLVCRHRALARLLRLILLSGTFAVARSQKEAYGRWS